MAGDVATSVLEIAASLHRGSMAETHPIAPTRLGPPSHEIA